MEMIYLDNNATTRPEEEVVAAVEEALRDSWHNPSSIHRPGQAVRQRLELAREQVAKLLGCLDREVVFTSGGTESDNLAIEGSLAAQPQRPVLVTSRLEHSAIRESAEKREEQGAEVLWLESDERGVIDVDHLAQILEARAAEIGLVSVMWANNEAGVIQPIEQIGASCREHGVRFHTDAVQWVGKMPTSVSSLPIDLLTFSAHKFHGPKGIGGLYVRGGVRIEPCAVGGPQERQRRGGTENVAGILGLGTAARLAIDWCESDARSQVESRRDRLEERILAGVDGARVNGAGAERLWNTTNIAFRSLEAEAILLLLSERGVCASAGAACSSGSLDPSPVLTAMRVPNEYAQGSIRFSLSRETTADEVDRAAEIIVSVIHRLQEAAEPRAAGIRNP